MNVLVVAEQLRRDVPGGIGTYVNGLIKGLRAEQAHRTNFNVETWASSARSDTDVVAELGVPTRSVQLPSKLLSRLWDYGLIRPSDDFDVVHATSLSVPPRGRAPMTAMVHDLAWRRFPDAFSLRGRLWHEKALGRTVERCAKLLVPSVATADDLLADGVAASRVVVVPEGVDHLPTPNREAARTALADAGVDGEFFLAVGTLEPRKNLIRLIEAYQQARSQMSKPPALVIVGPHGWGDALPVSQQAGVVTLGHCPFDLVTALYAMCHLFVSIPLMEGYGLPALEAMAMGAPVVASPMPSTGEAAFVVDPLDVAGIAKAMVLAGEDDLMRDDLRARGAEHASKMTWGAAARAHIEVWESL